MTIQNRDARSREQILYGPKTRPNGSDSAVFVLASKFVQVRARIYILQKMISLVQREESDDRPRLAELVEKLFTFIISIRLDLFFFFFFFYTKFTLLRNFLCFHRFLSLTFSFSFFFFSSFCPISSFFVKLYFNRILRDNFIFSIVLLKIPSSMHIAIVASLRLC